ncbi:DALR anticodon binding domain containing protein [Tritrichomonas foetus]|uniref:arginine--tRNA ligase n=1 Tax=Tritrichomonas foetus TaxID=1144522 RepID=A0A1J4K7G5_9EUKA|nr:DALR anticodon binding domain containing protein [Tritrichomonas foetus]|eukprot:OHT07319.1 DALR anticodon binding domain containing protein [Tritrichomonas foetus]
MATLPKEEKLENGKPINPAAFATKLAEQINNSSERNIIFKAEATGPYLNFRVNRGYVFKYVYERVKAMGEQYGSSKLEKPMKVIIEHTSANPNAPLHIGNLRNVMIGAHLARIMKFAGCDVKEYFYVNDLGGQIGLTALGYARLTRFPEMKIDQMIGSVYAIMNTMNEAQKFGFKLSEFAAKVAEMPPPDPNAEDEEEAEQNNEPKKGKKTEVKELTEEEKEKERLKKIEDCYKTGASLRARYPQLWEDLTHAFTDDESIQILGAALNKRYENRDPEAVKIIRQMTNATLTGQKQTLDTYNVKHDRFDFESEISWEGTSHALIELFRKSPFFHPQTQCNELGKPEGAYLDLDPYLDSIKAPRGKGGYSKPYPRFYVLRPDGTTLYTLRDVAYSMKKISEADMVLNVICTEQNLPQEKVMLTLKALGVPKRQQFHMAYELVKLSEKGKIKRMSGRKGYYILADTLYDDLRKATLEIVNTRNKKQVDASNADQTSRVCHCVASGCMKYALLCVSPRIKINFDISEAVDPQGNSAAFILYSGARIESILRKLDNGVKEGKFNAEPEEINWSLLNDDQEWEILTNFVMPFATKIKEAAIPAIPAEPKLPEFGTHVIPSFSYNLARVFSSYYSRVKVLSNDEAMYPRVKFCQTVLRVLHNALNLYMVEPLEAM